jgi:uncharacterized YigZ family protein
LIQNFKTIKEVVEFSLIEKGSNFIAIAAPVDTVQDFKTFVSTTRANHLKAVHCCYAYRIYNNNLAEKSSDDGEPTGTAGKPILNQILSHQLFNVSVIVIRYFGGTLLGVSGLIKAYKQASVGAINNAIIIEKEITQIFEIKFEYKDLNSVIMYLKRYNWLVKNKHIELDCIFIVEIPLCQLEYIEHIKLKHYGLLFKQIANS